MSRVYAFEWCDCIFESGFAVVSLYASKRGAFKAMVKYANDQCDEEGRRNSFIRKRKGDKPLLYKSWRVRTYEVKS